MAMLHKSDFFQEQMNQCRRLAEQASNKNDRQFWLKMTQRWEGVLVGRSSDDTASERIPKSQFIPARTPICETLPRSLAWLCQKIRQLGDVRCNPPCLVHRQQLR